MEQKNIAVFFGGCSTEHDVSLQSACAVLQSIDRTRYRPVPVGITQKGAWLFFPGNETELPDGNRNSLIAIRQSQFFNHN